MSINNVKFMSELSDSSTQMSLNGLSKESFAFLHESLDSQITDITFRVIARKDEIDENVARHLNTTEIHDNFDSIVHTLRQKGYTRIRFGVDGLEINYSLTKNDTARLLTISENVSVPIPLYYADGRYDMVVNNSDVGEDIVRIRIVLRNPMLFTSFDELSKRIVHLNKIAAYNLDLTEDIDKPRFSFVTKAN